MQINLENLIPITEANQNFSKVARMVDSKGTAVILKNNRPKYPTIEEKASRLCYSLIKNHAFLDGNKRIGIFVMLVLLELNDIVLDCTDEELVHLGLGVAASELTYEDILDFVKSH